MKAGVSPRLQPVLIFFVSVSLSPLFCADVRSAALELNLIIDGSASFAPAADNARAWLADYLVEKRLQKDDRITVWSAGEKAEILYSATVNETEKEAVGEALRSLPAKGGGADFIGALREAAARSSPEYITYTLLVSSPASLSPVVAGGNAALRFSRVEEFPGWRLMTVALNIEAEVRRAAAAYFSGN